MSDETCLDHDERKLLDENHYPYCLTCKRIDAAVRAEKGQREVYQKDAARLRWVLEEIEEMARKGSDCVADCLHTPGEVDAMLAQAVRGDRITFANSFRQMSGEGFVHLSEMTPEVQKAWLEGYETAMTDAAQSLEERGEWESMEESRARGATALLARACGKDGA